MLDCLDESNRKEAVSPPTDNITIMSTDTHSQRPLGQLPEDAKAIAHQTSEAVRDAAKSASTIAKDVTNEVHDALGEVTNTAKDMAERAGNTLERAHQSAVLKAGDILETSRVYVRRNPLPAVLGAIAFGAVMGYAMVALGRKRTLRERYTHEPLTAAHEAILRALAPVSQRLREGYDSVRDGAGQAIDRVSSLGTGHTRDSLSQQIGRIGNKLKFW